MSGGLISLFGDVDDFKTAMASEGFVGLLVTTPGQFRARLARVSLHGLHLAAGEEELARIAFVVVPQSSVLISLAFGGKSSPVWRGIQQQEGELVTSRQASARMRERSAAAIGAPCSSRNGNWPGMAGR